jgi:2-aminoethylphosphonate-pyruvate transaminase
MSDVKLAVILAAGRGTRLQGYIDNIPKGFIKLHEKTLIERSIETLKSNGIERVLIVTGYLSHFYEELAEKLDFVTTVKNPKFADSGSMFSLYEARERINEDFLLLESDLIFEDRAIRSLLNNSDDTAILLSGKTNSQDEVYVEAENGRVVNVTKSKDQVKNLAGELVGISKLSIEFFTQMKAEVEPRFEESLHLEYEADGIALTSKSRHPAKVLKVDDLAWAEIDNEALFLRARDEIFPKIESNNKYFSKGK